MSIHKRNRGNKPWIARFYFEGQQHSKSFRTKTEATSWEAAQRQLADTGDFVSPQAGRTTFANWVEEWQTGLFDLRPGTEAVTRSALRKHLLPAFGKRHIAKIRPVDVNRFIRARLDAGAAPSTISRHVSILRTILNDAVANNLIGSNPVASKAVKIPAPKHRQMRTLTHDEVARLVAHTPDWYRPLVLTAAYSGLRWGELAGLGTHAVDVLRGRLTVDRQLIETAGHLDFAEPKSKAGKRVVTLPSAIAKVVADQLDKPEAQHSGLVFPSPNATPLRRNNFRRRVWLKAVEQTFHGTDKEGLVFHELRHTAASLSIAAGAHPKTIQQRLGHSKIQVTMDTYGHLFDGHDDELASALDVALRAAQDSASDVVTLPTGTHS